MRTYGSLKLVRNESAWWITCEPHVAIRLKRLFTRARQEMRGEIVFRNTPESCNDLQWFMQRYPFEMSAEDAALLAQQASEHVRQLEEVEALLSARVTPPDLKLALPLRDYQSVAAALALQTRGLLLADDLGTGKTACAIGTFVAPGTLPALVVTMPHLLCQWEREIHRFAPELSVHILKKGQPYDIMAGKRGRRLDRFPDVILTNYHKLAGWRDVLSKVVKSVVYDEVQELRHRSSFKYDAAKQISEAAQYRMGLSATPIYNYGSEFWSVIECLRPSILGDYGEFLREWCDVGYGPSGKARIRDPKSFGTYLREQGLMLRRTRLDVGRELPPLQIIPQYLEADLDALNKVEDTVAELARIILQQGRAGFDKLKAAQDLDIKLRQATGIAKAKFAAEFVAMLVESGEPVVVYAWHREVHRILQSKLKAFNPMLYTGSESPSQKEAARLSFLEGRSKVLILSLRAGAGLDGLQQVCRTAVHAELDWSPGVHEQCDGRVFRDGQTSPVTSYYLIAEAGSDPIVADVLGVKRSQIAPVRDPDAELVEKLDVRDENIRKLAESVLRKRGLPLGAMTN